MNLDSILRDKDIVNLLEYKPKVNRDSIYIPGKNYFNNVFVNSSRSVQHLKNLSNLFNSGNLSGSGYLSILPVDHGIEHGALKSFSSNLDMFDVENIVKLAHLSGCSGVVLSTSAIRAISRNYIDKIVMIAKINHNCSKEHSQNIYSSVDEAYKSGASGIAATLYFGSKDFNSKCEAIAKSFEIARSKGMFTILWAYLRNNDYITKSKDFHYSALESSQANYIGANIGADIIKQKSPIFFDGIEGTKYNISSENKIDMVRTQVLHSFAGRVGLLNSGGSNNLVESAIINKLAGGMGIMAGRQIFSKPTNEAVKMLRLIQDIYLSDKVKVN